jgi:N-acetylglucosaminyldiphosphoundecaprenol N-acetyl-beta-D-mannosaminyltransferase
MSLVSDFCILTSRQEILREIDVSIQKQQPFKIFAINAHNLSLGLKDGKYLHILSNSVFNICDGVNVKRIIELTSNAAVECYPGPDLFDDLVFRKCLTSIGVHAFVGSTPEILSGLRDRFGTQNYHYIPIPFVESVDDLDIRDISHTINRAGADVIWIGLGTPKQEYFIDRLAPHLRKGVLIGVGAAFGFASGLRDYKRAPQWMREHHLEWLHRLIREPRRIGRRQVISTIGLLRAINRYG